MKEIVTTGFDEGDESTFRTYKLEGKTPVRCGFIEHAMAYAEQDWRVAQETVEGIVVSTVFLGSDHNFMGKGPPLLFETMLFGGERFGLKGGERCSTWDEAAQMHQDAIKLVRAVVAERATPQLKGQGQIEDKSDD